MRSHGPNRSMRCSASGEAASGARTLDDTSGRIDVGVLPSLACGCPPGDPAEGNPVDEMRWLDIHLDHIELGCSNVRLQRLNPYAGETVGRRAMSVVV